MQRRTTHLHTWIHHTRPRRHLPTRPPKTHHRHLNNPILMRIQPRRRHRNRRERPTQHKPATGHPHRPHPITKNTPTNTTTPAPSATNTTNTPPKQLHNKHSPIDRPATPPPETHPTAKTNPTPPNTASWNLHAKRKAKHVGTTPDYTDRAAGTLSGTHLGLVLGTITHGLTRTQATTTLNDAFPDFTTPHPTITDIENLATAYATHSPPPTPTSHPLPTWIPIALATGLTHPCDPIETLANHVGNHLPLEHRGRLTYAAAAATATLISAALEGAPWSQAFALSLSAADTIENATPTPAPHHQAGPSISARLTWAHALATKAPEAPADIITLLIGTSNAPQETLPAACAIIGMLTHNDTPPNPAQAARTTAQLGGDSTHTTTLVGAITGALAGQNTIPTPTPTPTPSTTSPPPAPTTSDAYEPPPQKNHHYLRLTTPPKNRATP